MISPTTLNSKRWKKIKPLGLILTDWYFLGIDAAESLLDLIDLVTQVTAPLGYLAQLGGEAREDVLRDGQQRGQLLEGAGKGTVRHRLELGAHRPARLRTPRHVAAAQVPRLHFSHHKRHHDDDLLLAPATGEPHSRITHSSLGSPSSPGHRVVVARRSARSAGSCRGSDVPTTARFHVDPVHRYPRHFSTSYIPLCRVDSFLSFFLSFFYPLSTFTPRTLAPRGLDSIRIRARSSSGPSDPGDRARTASSRWILPNRERFFRADFPRAYGSR